MGFFQPSPPPFDLEEWKAKPFLARLKPVVQDWAVNGFGAPGAIYLIYVVKLVVFVLGAALVISATTPGIGGLGDIEDWWFEPIVFQKVVAWTMLWEILGLGSGSLPLAARYIPPIGGVLYWLRPGTVRLPPWPDKVPLTRGTRRTAVDVALYAGVLATLVYLLFSDGEAAAGFAAGRLEPAGIVVALALLALLGLRDKVSFLAARPEIYGLLLLVSLWPLEHVIVGWQLVFICIWWGAASSKLNRHFPFVIAVMVSNTPWNRSKRMKAQLYEDYPERMRPSWRASVGAHLGTAVEFGLPLVLLITRGEGIIGTLALIGMIIFHVHITSTFALGVPLEWNLFMIFGLGFLYGHYAGAAAIGRGPADARGDRADRGPAPDRRQPDAGADLVPAGHALLRRQLGDEPVAVPNRGRRGGEARPRDLQDGADHDRAAHHALRPRVGRAPDGEGDGVPRASQPRPRAARAPAARGGRARRGLRRPRGRAGLGRRQRLELRRRPLPPPAAARGGAGAVPLRARRGARRRARVPARPGPAPALPHLRRGDGPRRGGLRQCGGHARARSLARGVLGVSRSRSREGGPAGSRPASP